METQFLHWKKDFNLESFPVKKHFLGTSQPPYEGENSHQVVTRYAVNLPYFELGDKKYLAVRGGSNIASTKANKFRCCMPCDVALMATVIRACFAADSLHQSILLCRYVGHTIKPGTPEHGTTEHRTPVEHWNTGGT